MSALALSLSFRDPGSGSIIFPSSRRSSFMFRGFFFTFLRLLKNEGTEKYGVPGRDAKAGFVNQHAAGSIPIAGSRFTGMGEFVVVVGKMVPPSHIHRTPRRAPRECIGFTA